jgi:hypothetical protein
VLNKGTLVSEEQLLNIEAILVTDAVLNKGTLRSEKQLANIELIVVTDSVLNKGTLVSEEQLLNIEAILVTDAVASKDIITSRSFLLARNQLTQLVKLPAAIKLNRSKFPLITVLVAPGVIDVALGTESAISNQPVL